MVHNKVKLFLDTLRGQPVIPDDLFNVNDSSYTIMVEIFNKGNCGNLAILLHISFGGQPYFIKECCHVVTLIGGRLYDISGDCTTTYTNVNMRPITLKEIQDECLQDNYSFHERGPII
jgi:hypothetical protein